VGATALNYILTHGDLDGMVSAILLLQRLPEDTPIAFTNHRWLARDLKKAVGALESPASVYITDVPLEPEKAKVLAGILQEARSTGFTFRLYDHHFGWNEQDAQGLLRPLFATYCVDDRKRTAAALVWRDFLKCDEQSRRWLELLREKSESEDLLVQQDFGTLVALMDRRHWHLQELAIGSLARGDERPPEVVDLARWYYEEHVPREKAIASRTSVSVAASGLRIAWVDLRGEKERYNVAKTIIAEYGVDLVAQVLDKYILLGSSGIDMGPDLSPLHGEHIRENTRFRIAGHLSPVNISSKEGGVTDGFVETIRAFLHESL